MKIVHVMNWYIPGMGYQENCLPAEQKKLGHDVEVVTSDRYPPYEGYHQHVGKLHDKRIVGSFSFEDNGIIIHRLPTLEFKRGQVLLKGLKQKLKKLKPDVVQAHGVPCFLTIQTALLQKKFHFRLFIDDHTNYQNYNLTSWLNRVYLKFIYIVYKYKINNLTEAIMPVTFGSMEFLEKQLDIPRDKMVLLPLGCDIDLFSPSENIRQSIRKKLGIINHDILLICSGKFTPQKDIEILIKAFEKIYSKHKNIKLLLLGGWTPLYFNYISSIIDRYGLKQIVRFHEFVPNKELPDYYNAADIGVWPGTNTITTVEALSVGLPVVVSKDLTTKHMISNKNGYNFERGNIEQLAIILGILVKNDKMRKEMGQRSRELVKEELSWNVIAKKSIEIYSEKNERVDNEN